MADAVQPDTPKEKDPIPTSIGGLIAYGLKQFVTMSADKSQVLILCLLVGWFVWQSWDAQQKQQARDDERYAQDRRDKVEAEERGKQKEIEVTKMVLTHCSNERALLRNESQAHMKDALEELAKLRMSIQMFAAELARFKKSDLEECPMPREKQ